MQPNNPTSVPAASEKRNLGFVKLRRGLREHLHRSRMSSNASTLFVWLLLSAYHSGPKRGCVETNYEDVMRGLGWYRKLLQRSIWELTRKGYVRVTPAANQHGMTIITILKFDVQEFSSAQDTGVLTKHSAQDTAEDSAHVDSVPTTVPSRPPILQEMLDLQAPKNALEVKNKKNEKRNAVRRRFDAERLADRTPPFRKENLQNRLEKKIESTNDSYLDWIDSCRKRGEGHPFGTEEQKAFEATGYKPDLGSPLLSFDFVTTVVDVYEETRKKDISAGNLCSRIIDRCQSERERNYGEGYYWPPDFQDHRDRLRIQERARELMSANKVGHTGSGVKP
jgi:hypothetical protein